MEHPRFSTNEIYVFPIKSGPAVKRSFVSFEGDCLEFDRQWMLVDAQSQFITLRSHPVLNTLELIESEHQFSLIFENEKIDFNKIDGKYDKIEVRIWNSTVLAYTTQFELAHWLSKLLKQPIQVVVFPDRIKPISQYIPSDPVRLSFQDGYPVHVINLASLRWIEQQCDITLDPLQFRANFYIDADPSFDEDHWDRFYINQCVFRRIKATERCQVVNLPKKSLRFNPATLKALAKHRSFDNKVLFGIYALPVR